MGAAYRSLQGKAYDLLVVSDCLYGDDWHVLRAGAAPQFPSF